MAVAEDRRQRLAQPFSIVCLSSQEWDAAVRTNRQQVMLRAARHGHRVLFVETGHFLGKHLWSLLRRRGRRLLVWRVFAAEEVAPGCSWARRTTSCLGVSDSRRGDYEHFAEAAEREVAALPNAYARSCFPFKLYEYLAATKPVVPSGLPELPGMEPDILLADGTTTFIQAVKEALGRNVEAERLRRKELAARSTWETKTEPLLELVRRELEAGRPTA
jgi:hypothetical protein